jgi:hypothetical protein
MLYKRQYGGKKQKNKKTIDLFKRERVISIAKTIGIENKLRDGFPFLGGDRRFYRLF